MSARAPEAIQTLWRNIHTKMPRAVLSGIVGDVNHSFGYHLARRDLPPSDYSVKLRLDRLGRDDCASALDVSLPPDLMKTCTHRLLAAARTKDARLKALREFCGTIDGNHTYPWDLATNGSEGVGSWDDSHLWHIHLSFYRAYADDAAALAPIADVLAGIPVKPAPTPSPTLEEIVTLDPNSAQYKRLVSDIAHAVWNSDVIPGPVDPKTGKPNPKNPTWAQTSWLNDLRNHILDVQAKVTKLVTK